MRSTNTKLLIELPDGREIWDRPGILRLVPCLVINFDCVVLTNPN